MIKTAISGFTLAVLAISFAVDAGNIYKWKDANGRIHIGDQPPPASAVEKISVRAINTFSGATAAVPDDSVSATGEKVVIYTTQRCGYCRKAKAFLRRIGIAYMEYDVETSSKGKRDYKAFQGRGVPVIMVGNRRLNGFSESYLTAALKSAGYAL